MEKELCKLSIELRARPSLFPLLSSCSHTMGLGDSLRAPHVFGDLTCKLNFIFLKARMLASKKKLQSSPKKKKIFLHRFLQRLFHLSYHVLCVSNASLHWALCQPLGLMFFILTTKLAQAAKSRFTVFNGTLMCLLGNIRKPGELGECVCVCVDVCARHDCNCTINSCTI